MVLGTGDRAMNETDKAPAPKELTFRWRETDKKHTKPSNLCSMFKGEKCHSEQCTGDGSPGRRKGCNFERGSGGRSHRTDAFELEGGEVGSVQMCGGRRILGRGSSRQQGFEKGECWMGSDKRNISVAGPLP